MKTRSVEERKIKSDANKLIKLKIDKHAHLVRIKKYNAYK